MDFNTGYFYILFPTGVVFVLCAMMMYIFPPKEINGLYGYRTVSSMKSPERWAFAQRFSAITMLQSGIALILCSLLPVESLSSQKISIILVFVLMFVAVFATIFRTERAIKQRFQN